MKQSEIDRWMRRQARRNTRVAAPSVNWIAVATVIMIVVACLFLLLKITHMA